MSEINKLYSIGEVARMANLSVKTIRYYDEIGLLKPTKVDDGTNYRYYSINKVLYAQIIKKYKELALSLDEIKIAMADEDISTLIILLEKKLSDTDRSIHELLNLKESLQANLSNLKLRDSIEPRLETGNSLFEVRKIPQCLVAFTRYRSVHNPNTFIRRFSELLSIVEQYKLQKSGPLIALFYDDYRHYDYQNADIEVCIQVVGAAEGCPNVRSFGGFQAVTGFHKGSYVNLPKTYEKALMWMENHGYSYHPPAIERYIVDASSTSFDENYLTEFYFPIK